MGVEVELKAWVTEPEALKRKLADLGSPQRTYHKLDRYYGPNNDLDAAQYRIRRDGEVWLCTYKEKRIDAGIEENREIEFSVSDGPSYERILESLGLRRVITKEKKGEAFSVDGILAEVSLVRHVGWFVELEIILPDDADPEAVRRARERLQALLHTLGIPPTAIESRSYNRMIYEATSQAGSLPGDSL